MITKMLNNYWLQATLILTMCVGTLLCIFPLDFLWAKWMVNFTVYFMLFYFFLGFLFLTLRQPKLTFVAFGTSAVLCIFLKEASHADVSVVFPTNAPTFRIAHFNLSNSDQNATTTIEAIKNTKADLISIQEITPFWDSLLQKKLSPNYPFNFVVQNINIFGLAVYSKNEFQFLDTICYHNIPNIVGQFKVTAIPEPINFISTLVMPPASHKGYQQLTRHLNKVEQYCTKTEAPLFAFGDYHSVPWSNEIQDFRKNTQLLDSRRGFAPTYPDGALNFFWTPVDYIFFSPHFKCISFETISSETSRHLGIQGVFQYYPSSLYEKNNFKKTSSQF